MKPKTNMFKLLSKFILLPISFIAVFFITWSTSHIHTLKQHNHDVDAHKHQHQVQIHNHNLKNIDISHNSSHLNAIKIEYQSNLQEIQHSKKTLALLSRILYTIPPLLNVNVKVPHSINQKLAYLDYSKLHSRAPPQLS